GCRPESPPVFGSALGGRVGVAAPVVAAAVAALVAAVVAASVAAVVAASVAAVVAASVAAPVVAASVAVPVVCNAGAAAPVAPTSGTSIRLNTRMAATATATASDVLRIMSSLSLYKRPAKHTDMLRRVTPPQPALCCKFSASKRAMAMLIGKTWVDSNLPEDLKLAAN